MIFASASPNNAGELIALPGNLLNPITQGAIFLAGEKIYLAQRGRSLFRMLFNVGFHLCDENVAR